MEYIEPVAFTIISGAAEPGPGEVAWAAGAYAVGTMRYLASTHRIYRRELAAGPGGATDDLLSPDTFAALEDGSPGKLWKDWAPTNRYAMFDQAIGSVTTAAASPYVVVLEPEDFVDSVAVFDATADAVLIEVLDGASVVSSNLLDLYDANDVIDGWEYSFKPIKRKTTVVLKDLPPVTGGRIRITFTNASAAPKVGTCVLGRLQRIGDTEWSPAIGVNTYSTKAYDPRTKLTTVQSGPAVRRFNASVVCPTSAVDAVVEALIALSDTPVVWLGVETQFASLIVYGFARDWEMVIRYQKRSWLTARVESLT